jgi:ATP-dependent Lon protease
LNDLDEKIVRVFGDMVVDKRLSRIDIVARLPKFIAEYLVSTYSKRYPSDWHRRVAGFVEEYYPDPRDRDRVLSKAKEEGSITLIDEFKVRVDLRKNMYFLQIPVLQIYDAIVSEDIVRRYERILTGVWGVGRLDYEPHLPELAGDDVVFTPLVLTEFEPFQVYNVDLKTFTDGRRHFSLDEWVDFLIKSIGLNPRVYDFKRKILLLFRLVPLAEGNVNLLELGPRATGKTFIYRNISYYTRIYAGGTVSAARLFYDNRLKLLGDIGVRDAVVFDEIAKVRFSNQDEVVAKLKDYMVDGFFERGQLQRAHSNCSLVFIGNMEFQAGGGVGDLVAFLPDFMKDTAFLDRIHGLLPGWEIPKISRSEVHLASGYGLAADYLSEILHKLRARSFEKLVEDHLELVGEYTIRDERAVKKLAAGITKLLFPHGEFDVEELEAIARMAVNLRIEVVKLLNRLGPHEFPLKHLDVRVRG